MKLQDLLLNVAIKCETLQAFGVGLIVAVLWVAIIRIEDGFMTIRLGPKGIVAFLFGAFVLLIAPRVKKWVEK